MLEALPPGILNGVGVVGVVFLVGWWIGTGRWIPRKTYDDVVHEKNEWRAESRIKDAQIAEKDKQLEHVAEVGRTVESVLTAIQRISGAGR